MDQEQLLSQLEEILDMEPNTEELLGFLEGLLSYIESEYGPMDVTRENHSSFASLIETLTQRLCSPGAPEQDSIKIRLLDVLNNTLCPDYNAGTTLTKQLQRWVDLLALHQMYSERSTEAFESKLREHLKEFLNTVDQEYQAAYEKKRKFDAGKIKLYLQRAETAESALAAAKANVEMTRASLKSVQAENEKLRAQLAILKRQTGQ